MPTAASRPGGKFGKFSGRGKTSLPTESTPNNDNNTSTTISSTNASGIENDPNNPKRNNITMEMIQSKRDKIKRRNVFDKLDTAEKLVLDLIYITKETTQGLNYLAREGHDDNDNKDEEKESNLSLTTSQDENDTIMANVALAASSSNDSIHKKEGHWKKKIKHNGKLYMEKLKEIHDLLLPHKELIVNYGAIQHHEIQQSSPNQNNQDEDVKEDKNTIASANNKNDTKIEKNLSMYESKLEMKLAIQKKNLLHDLVALEKKIMLQEQEVKDEEMDDKLEYNVNCPTNDPSHKRKREDT